MSSPSALLFLGLPLLAPLQEPPPDPVGAEVEAVEEAEEDRPPQNAFEWFEKVNALASGVDANANARAEADALYPQLSAAFRRELDQHRGVFRLAESTSDRVRDVISLPAGQGQPDETVAEHYATLVTFYQARLRLLEVVTPGLHARLTGTGVMGVEELKLELAYIVRHSRYQRLAIPDGMRRALHDLRISPFPTLSGVLFMAVVLVLFYKWRRWAAEGIPAARKFVQSTWPRSGKGLAAFLWFVAHVRKPLEWLALASVFFSMVDVPEIPEPKGVLEIAAVWILLAWFAVVLVDAFATRATSPGKLERSPLRLRSLRVIATWLVILGLGLHLATHLAGRATIHAWVWRLFEFLAFPVAIALLLIWRPEIKRRLEREARFSTRIERLLKRRGERFGFFETLAGIAYLLVLWIRRLSLKLARKSVLGRTLVAEALRQRMVRTSVDPSAKEGQQVVDPELRERWLQRETLVGSASEKELEQVLDMVKRGWPFVAIVGERGGGKSAFLKTLVSRFEGRAVRVRVEHWGAEETLAALARALGLEASAPLESIGEAIRREGIGLLAWDGIHRLARPVLGGHAELDRVGKELAPWLEGIPTIATVDSAAWQYLSRLREARVSGASTVELPAWTEAEIGELIERRAEEIGIVLSYQRLTFPRLLLEQEFDSPEQGLRASFRRLLWGEADGNPSVALRLVADRVIAEPDGTYAVQLPQGPAASELEGVNLETLLVLRFLLQTDGARIEDMVAGLRYPEGVVRNSIRTSLMRGWIEEQDGRYLVTWKWYRTITRVLVRRNLLAPARQSEKDDTSLPEASRRRRPRMRPPMQYRGPMGHMGPAYRGFGR